MNTTAKFEELCRDFTNEELAKGIHSLQCNIRFQQKFCDKIQEGESLSKEFILYKVGESISHSFELLAVYKRAFNTKAGLTYPEAEELMELCLNGVLPCRWWEDRDSACAQKGLQRAYCALRAGIPFLLMKESDGDHFWIQFTKISHKDMRTLESFESECPVDTVAQYFEEMGHDNEMFEPCHIEWTDDSIKSFYIPTELHIKRADGGDWYVR